jgi:branched-chain amino acid transport system ATP-binding protein
MPAALEARGLSKAFHGFTAVDGVDLVIEEGETHAIIGPNGAGKTTLFNLLSGFLTPTAGKVLLFGEDITHVAPHKIVRRGLSRSFQVSSVFDTLSVQDNLLVALQSKSPHHWRFWERLSVLRKFQPRAREILEVVHELALSLRPASSLSHGEKRNLEIGISLTQEPRVLLLDEPTSGMGTEDVQRMVALGKKVAKGRTLVLVEHNMGVVAQLADRITVLQRGRILAQGTYEEVRKNPHVIEAYLGEEVV